MFDFLSRAANRALYNLQHNRLAQASLLMLLLANSAEAGELLSGATTVLNGICEGFSLEQIQERITALSGGLEGGISENDIFDAETYRNSLIIAKNLLLHCGKTMAGQYCNATLDYTDFGVQGNGEEAAGALWGTLGHSLH
jgi:hypothetical protein